MSYNKNPSRRPRSPWHPASPPPIRNNYIGVNFRSNYDLPKQGSLPPHQEPRYPRVPPLPHHHQKGLEDSYNTGPQRGRSEVLRSLPNDSHTRSYNPPEYPSRTLHRRYKDQSQQHTGFYPTESHLLEDARELSQYIPEQTLGRHQRYGSLPDDLRYNRRGILDTYADPRFVPRGHIPQPPMGVSPYDDYHLGSHSRGLGNQGHVPTDARECKENAGQRLVTDSLWGNEELWDTEHMQRHNSLPSLGRKGSPGLYPSHGIWRERAGLWYDTSYQDLLSLRFLASPDHAASFIERFVHSCIEDLLLDVSAEVLVESRELQDILERTPHPVISAAKDVLQECVQEEVVAIAEGERQKAVVRYWRDIANNPSLLYLLGEELLFESIDSELMLVAADAVDELVEDYLIECAVVDVYTGLYNDAAEQLLLGVAKEALLDLSLESIINDLVDGEINLALSSYIAEIHPTGCSSHTELCQSEDGRR